MRIPFTVMFLHNTFFQSWEEEEERRRKSLELLGSGSMFLLLPLQRTGIYASLSLIIKHGLTSWVHRHNTLSSYEFTFSV